MKRLNGRQITILILTGGVLLLGFITFSGIFLGDKAMETDFSRKNLAPSWNYLFGTDWLGRDMFARTLTGLSLSIRIGLLTAAVSALTALIMGIGAAALGRYWDGVISWVIDLILGIPHILLVMLISFGLGRGFAGVTAGVALSHWPSLARVIRGEVLQQKQAPYVLAAKKMGSSPFKIARMHMLPFVLPQFLIGLILQFPHAILHEAGITFLGFGLSPEQPAIGIILSESMGYLTTGKWWLALFPGLSLVLVVVVFSIIGDRLGRLINPAYVHQ